LTFYKVYANNIDMNNSRKLFTNEVDRGAQAALVHEYLTGGEPATVPEAFIHVGHIASVGDGLKVQYPTLPDAGAVNAPKPPLE
jgi:hypothetical protein